MELTKISEKELKKLQNNEEASLSKENIRLFLDMICGESGVPNQRSKCMTTISNYLGDMADLNNMKVLSSFDTSQPIIKVQRRGEFIFVSYDFQSVSNSDMRHFFKSMEEYGSFKNELADSEEKYVNSITLVVPLAFPNVTLSLQDPIFWTYQAPNPTAKITEIHAVYKAGDVEFFVDDLDIEAAKKVVIAQEQAETQKIQMEISELKKEIVDIKNKELLDDIKAQSGEKEYDDFEEDDDDDFDFEE